MMTPFAFLAVALPIALAVLAACGARALGWGALAMGFAGVVYLLTADPGLQALVIIPISGLLIVVGIVTLARARRTAPRQDAAS